MGTFKSSTTIYSSPANILYIADAIEQQMLSEGYSVEKQSLISGGCDISITKGGLFKAVLGMKTALKVSLQPAGSNISIEAGVGIFGQQAIPTVISMLFFWPVLLTQIWGLIKQSNLDDHVIAIAQASADKCGQSRNYSETSATGGTFCPNCGGKNAKESKFCCHCGREL